MWEKNVDINQILEIRAKTNVFLGVGAITKIDVISEQLKQSGVDKVVILTGKAAYKSTGAWAHVEKALKNNSIGYVLYDKVTPNPTVDQIDEATKLGREFGAKAVIGIGGGSPIDAAKSTAVLLEYTDKNARQLYGFEFTPVKAAPLVAINLTHGTGTEVDRFAVATITESEFKPALAYDCLYPAYAIDDPQLMVGLPANQTRFVSIDAVNHVVEGATSLARSPYSIMLAKETIRLVAEYLPKALENPTDLEARYYLTYASMIAGVCFDNGLLHFTHALEHPLSGVKPDLAHGLGLAILLPGVVKEIYAEVPSVLADILEPFAKGLKGEASEADAAAEAVYAWLKSVGVGEKLTDIGFEEKDIDKLVNLAFETPSLGLLLSMAPVTADKDAVRRIYTNSL